MFLGDFFYFSAFSVFIHFAVLIGIICCTVWRTAGTSQLDRLSVATDNDSSSSKLWQDFQMLAAMVWCCQGHYHCTHVTTLTVVSCLTTSVTCCVTRHENIRWRHFQMLAPMDSLWPRRCKCTRVTIRTVGNSSVRSATCCVTRQRNTAVHPHASLVCSESGWHRVM